MAQRVRGQALPPETRQAIIADLKTGDYGRNEIARRHDVGWSTVTKIAKDENLDSARGIVVTEAATRAVAATVREKREKLKNDLLDDVQRLRHRAWSEYVRVVPSKEGPITLRQDLPPLDQVRNAYTSIGTALDGFFKLEALDAQGPGRQESRDFLTELHDQLSAAYADYEQQTQAVADDLDRPQLPAGGGGSDDDG